MPRLPFAHRIRAPIPAKLTPTRETPHSSPANNAQGQRASSASAVPWSDYKRNAKGTAALTALYLTSILFITWHSFLFWKVRKESISPSLTYYGMLLALFALVSLGLIGSIYMFRWLWSWRAAYQQRRMVRHWRVLLWTSIAFGMLEFILGVRALIDSTSKTPQNRVLIHGTNLWAWVVGLGAVFVVLQMMLGLASVALARVRNQNSPLVHAFMPFLPVGPPSRTPIELADLPPLIV